MFVQRSMECTSSRHSDRNPPWTPKNKPSPQGLRSADKTVLENRWEFNFAEGHVFLSIGARSQCAQMNLGIEALAHEHNSLIVDFMIGIGLTCVGASRAHAHRERITPQP